MTPEERRAKFREYVLRETRVAVEHMLDNRESIHAFDLGTVPDKPDTMLSMLLVVGPKDVIDLYAGALAEGFAKAQSLQKQ